MNKSGNKLSFRLLLAALLPACAIIASIIYVVVRTVLFIIADYPLYEKLLAACLLGAEFFILTHGVGYFIEIIHVYRQRKDLSTQEVRDVTLDEYPPIAVIVSSYKEPLSVVEDTIITLYNLRYPNKRVYFLDDTRYDQANDNREIMDEYKKSINDICERVGVDLFRRRWHGAKAGMINDFLALAAGDRDKILEYYDYSGSGDVEMPKYIAIFDADQNPMPSFVDELVCKMENDSSLAFVQTPQYYTNFETNRVARAAGLQQAVFYEYICEGKGISDAMFCCGTNVLFRTEALLDVGGFEENSVTEDFATSLKFHLKGWHSAYVNRVGVFGMGPEELGGYFKQQFRWALGTVGLIRKTTALLLRNPRGLTKLRWWEYFLSCTYYFIGIVFFVVVMYPILFLFLNIPSYFARSEVYAMVFLPYFIMSITLFFWAMKERRYNVKDMLTGQLLISITFPVYIKAAILGVFGVKGSFRVTSKSGAAALPLVELWPQVSLALLNFAAIVWGANRLMYEQQSAWAISINMFWCTYHMLVLSSVFYFNNPEAMKK